MVWKTEEYGTIDAGWEGIDLGMHHLQRDVELVMKHAVL